MEVEGSLPKVSSILKSITKRKCEAASLIKAGLHELETLKSNLEHLGLKVRLNELFMVFCITIFLLTLTSFFFHSFIICLVRFGNYTHNGIRKQYLLWTAIPSGV